MTHLARLSALILSSTLIAAPAMADTWDCSFKKSRGGATSERVIIQTNASGGKTLVIDGLIQHYVGKPVEARSTKDTTSTLTVRWDLPSVKDERNQWIPGIGYSVYIEKASGKARITGRPSGNYVEVRSTGTCKRK